MNTYFHLAFVYLNEANPPHLFMLSEDMFLVDLKFKLNTLLRYPKNRRIVKHGYRSTSIDNERKIRPTMLELKTDNGLKSMWSTFYNYSTNDLIEVDVTIAISGE